MHSEISPPTVTAPSFITETFFMTHILISLITKKVEQQYEQLSKMINDAAHKKDMATYEELMGAKMCIDVHLIGKNTLAGYRSFFTFTGALFITLNNADEVLSKTDDLLKDIFENVDLF